MNKENFIDANHLLKFLDGGMRSLESELRHSLVFSNDEKIENARLKGMLEAYRFIQTHIENTIEKTAKEVSKK